MTKVAASVTDLGHTIQVRFRDEMYGVERSVLLSPEEAYGVFKALQDFWVSASAERMESK